MRELPSKSWYSGEGDHDSELMAIGILGDSWVCYFRSPGNVFLRPISESLGGLGINGFNRINAHSSPPPSSIIHALNSAWALMCTMTKEVLCLTLESSWSKGTSRLWREPWVFLEQRLANKSLLLSRCREQTKCLSQYYRAFGDVFRRRILVGPVADARSARDKQHRRWRDLGHE